MDDVNKLRPPSFLMPRDPSIDRRFRPCPRRQQNLNEIYEEFEESDEVEVISSDSETESVSSDIVGSSRNNNDEAALVYLRLKPVDTFCEYYKVHKTAGKLITTTSNGNEKEFIFSEIFDGLVGQKDVYEQCVRPRIDNEDGFTVMSYGTSGSGKTFTLIGNDMEPGILPRGIEHIFQKYGKNIHQDPAIKIKYGEPVILSDEEVIAENRSKTQILSQGDFSNDYSFFESVINNDHDLRTTYVENTSVFIWVSFLEIYNENVYDLLAIPKRTQKARGGKADTLRKNLKVVSNQGKVYVKDLVSVHVKSAEEAYHVLRTGLKGVTYANTGVNSNSSRSHFIFMLHVIKFSLPNLITHKTYRFCDLAGSERQTKTNCEGSRLKEAQQINKSLVVLGRCLDAANSNLQKKANQDVIPIRESKLTMLLQPPLLGKEKLCMIVALTPIEQFFEENMNVLNYASIAKNIVYKSQIKKDVGRRFSWFTSTNYESRGNDQLVDELMAQNSQLIQEKQELCDQLIIMESEYERKLTNLEDRLRKELNAKYMKREEEKSNSWKQLMEIETKKIDLELRCQFRQMLEEKEEQNDELQEEILDLRTELNDEIEAKKMIEEKCLKFEVLLKNVTTELDTLRMERAMSKGGIQRKKSNVLEDKENF